MTERLKATPAAYLILIKGSRILFHLRQNSGYMDGQYSLVAGHLEKGEGPTECIIREAREEIGIKLKPENLELVHAMYRIKPNDGDERVDFFYVCDAWEGEIRNVEPHKCADLRFFDPDEFPENMVPYVEQVIKDFVFGNKFSEYFHDDDAMVLERESKSESEEQDDE